MNKIRVLIVDDNILTSQALYDRLSECHDFEMLNMAKDGLEAIEIIERDQPHVVLLDIIMPKLDGIGVLEHANANRRENRPLYIIYSAVSHENYVSRAMNLGADYYIIKPFDESVLAYRIRQFYMDSNTKPYAKKNLKINLPQRQKNRYDDELKILATKYMREYGLKAHMTGYCYIRDIVTESFDSYCQHGTLPKGIYREIASKNNVSIQKVERAIRNCIENVLLHDSIEKKPTNSQVICQLIEKIRTNN
ncbi:MAG: response regulator receiver protein [Eubacterium sp.]|jgi:two-component system response regulator (stage 0 sporulation protein A)|nr:response regulator receiver protein [Eubacterium sp.]